MLTDLIKRRWSIDIGRDYASGVPLAPQLGAVTVQLGAVPGQFYEVDKIEGGSGIQLRVPISGFIRKRATQVRLQKLRGVFFGVVIHESTHVAQRACDPAAFNAANVLENELRKTPSPTQNDWFNLYVGQPLEQEARAHQAAAEVLISRGRGLTRADFNSAWPATEVHARTVLRIGARAAATTPMAAWWSATEQLAYDVYSAL